MNLLKRIKIAELTIVSLLILTPLILWVIEGYQRQSISDYAYSKYNYVFNFLLNLGGFLFVFNFVFNKKHYYNFILGLSLLGVSLTPHLDYPIMHYIFATIFFLGSCVSIILSSDKRFFLSKIIVSMFIIACMLLHFIYNVFTLFEAEWLGIIPISIHFIIKSINHKVK
jgi:hypothetical protein